MAEARQKTALPMSGPDFMLAQVRAFSAAPDGTVLVQLANGDEWNMTIAPGALGSLNLLELAQKQGGLIFISGDRAKKLIDRVALPRKLAVVAVKETADGDRLSVSFAGPPQIYHLLKRRPWAAEAERIISASFRHWKSGGKTILVSIDIVTNEIMDARE